MKKFWISLLFVAIACLLAVTKGFAQTGELSLRLSRDFGYGGFNNDIQGLFSMKVTGPADLVRVVFYIDGTEIGEITQAPFNLQFNTDNYPLGQHELSSVGYSSTGQQYSSNKIVTNFVPATESTKIIFPVLAVVFGVILLSFIIPLVSGGGKIQNLPFGVERKYGFGGGICPKCRRPFALPLISMHLGFSKLARCPYCGKMSLVRVESLDKLRQAEKAELGWGRGEVKEESEEEKLRRDIDDSRFQGL